MNITTLLIFSLSSTLASCFLIIGSTKYSSRLYAKRDGGDKILLKDLIKEIKHNPDKILQEAKQKKKARRTRRRVENPKQKYVYAAQRQKMSRNSEQSAEAETNRVDEYSPIYQAKQMGLMNTAGQHCDVPIAPIEPKILGRVLVGEDANKGDSYVYVIDKPVGWSILGSSNKKLIKTKDPKVSVAKKKKNQVVEEEIQQDDASLLDLDEADLSTLMTPEEIKELKSELEASPNMNSKSLNGKSKRPTAQDYNTNIDSSSIKAASFELYTRPSVVKWLKESLAQEGTLIRGGKYWTAVAGASNVNDSGLVVISPKNMVENIFIDYAKYVAVVGNGRFNAALPKAYEKVPSDLTKLEVLSKVKKGRNEDTIFTVDLTIAEKFSTCDHVTQICQEELSDGIRGDQAANPFDCRAPRRLVHCNAITVSSLAFDDGADVETKLWPDDIAIYADRRNRHGFENGSFLGRADLAENPCTNCYREINGAADGFPGWTVDRYDKWLLVQHDDQYPRGPLPSIHDGKTAGIYYINSLQNRGMMGRKSMRPILLEGQLAPDIVPVKENGVTYLATLDKDLSTGIFLDQRLQRAWLTRNCNSESRVLNCFAHCGAFSIAAASAGASTLSLDLNEKFLDRIPEQLQLNGIEYDRDHHDYIYGDCFDWLARLLKRGEKFDIIILDPPSTSVGTKKKRWSVQNDMAELVSLAAPMVNPGGLLWTTTNSAALHPIKFAKMCQKGLLDAGIKSAKLERISPMPIDFPSIETPPVKNLVWRIP
mmetsp:Transcript_11463/g.16809  ORF Transcript_11463/g.16809 Transcript_11463/m.16809 type:complete len:766 (+) Transcript_11463:114-2411(+)